MDTHPEGAARLTKPDLLWALGLGFLVWLVYLATLSPSLSYASPDGNELATIPAILGLAHPPGYPLYTWLGWVFTQVPVGDVAYRVNLMSATLGAMAVSGLFLVSVQLLPATLTWRRGAAGLPALLLAFGPTMWSQAVIAEVYAPNLAFVALTLLCLLQWERTRRDRDFFAFALVFGLSLGMHISDLGFAPAMAAFILLADWRCLRRPTWWLAGLAGFGLGAAQFGWILLQVNRLDPHLLLGKVPTGLAGLYAYTLGSFSDLKFAFPIVELPERLVVYLYYLGRELGGLAILVGFGGLVSLLLRRQRHFVLLVGMYLFHVWFFIQYRVFDLEVFFLPAHLLWAVFVAFGVAEILTAARRLLLAISRGAKIASVAGAAAAGLLLLSAALPMLGRWRAADHSDDVEVNDFYANVWETLPPDSVLLTPGGVFGYDAWYWQLVYGIRPDVALPVSPSPQAGVPDIQGRPLYSSTSRQMLERRGGRWAPPGELLPENPWLVPVLVGNQTEESGLASLTSRGRLILCRLDSGPPSLIIDQASPDRVINASVGGVEFIGADVEPGSVESGGRIHLVLYWRLPAPRAVMVDLALDGEVLGTHEIGFGNLQRYQAEVGPVSSGIVREDFWLVIPSTAPAGEHTLSLKVDGDESVVEIVPLIVVDELERYERWLNAAG